MGYNNAQYQQFDCEEKAHKIKRKGSDYDAETRYISRKGHREVYQKVADEAEDIEPTSKGFRKVKVTTQEPEPVAIRSLKVRTASNKKERYEGRKGSREFKEDILEPEESEVSEVEDEDTIKTVSRALTTRSQKLRDIEEKAYKTQYGVQPANPKFRTLRNYRLESK
jgi:hypothetical protein